MDTEYHDLSDYDENESWNLTDIFNKKRADDSLYKKKMQTIFSQKVQVVNNEHKSERIL